MTQPPPDQTQPVSPVPPSSPPPPPPHAAPQAPTQAPTHAAPHAAARPTLPPPPDPGPTATMPSAPAGAPGAATRSADPSFVLRAVLGLLVLGLTVVALAVEENAERGYEAWTTWAVFATVVAAVHLVPLVWRGDPRRVWDVVAVATAGLVFYWLALVLPMIGEATSFAQTLAVACALAHLWVLPGRR